MNSNVLTPNQKMIAGAGVRLEGDGSNSPLKIDSSTIAG